ncbi:MAG: hypothetical protein ABI702_26670 [Burkholderiales bacterium]
MTRRAPIRAHRSYLDSLCVVSAIVVASQTVRAELPELWSAWTVAMWFATANARLDGRMPVEALGSDFAGVLQAAQALASIEDTSFMQERQKFEFAAHA